MEHKVEFRGNGAEYFGIWIVNILLSIITIGIYSAWAKVRTNRYFYGNSYIDGHPFDYHANPIQILIGRIIILASIFVLSIISEINPIFALIVFFIYLFATPWFIARGLRFSRRVTSYRNVRFDFVGTYGGALWSFIVLPLFNALVLFLATPYVSRSVAKYVGEHTRYGDRPVNLKLPVGPLYKIFAIFMTIIVIVLFVAISAVISNIELGSGLAPNEFVQEFSERFGHGTLLTVVAIYITIRLGNLFYTATLRNLTFDNMVLDGRHTFKSTVNSWAYVFVVLSNVFLRLITLGLATPWARVRVTKFLATNTFVIADGPLDVYSSQIRAQTGILGEEYMDVEGVDLGAAI